MNAPLVVFGEDWGAHPSSTQHLVKRLMETRLVLWANSIGLRRPRLTDVGRVLRKGRAMMRSRPKPEDGPMVIQPKALPFPGSPSGRRINRYLLGRSLGKALRDTGIERPILWTSLPTAVDAVGTLDERAVVYYCGDDFGALAGVDHAEVRAMEDELVEKADLILAASPALAARFPEAKTRVLPHGVDLDLFATPAESPSDLPYDRPVAGFYGSLSDWLDQDLVASAARLLPDWDFVLIGPERTDLSRLRALPNVRLLGPRPHDQLPGYVQNWTVSMLPFVDNDQIRACNPLKLREYLAAGRPVVSTDFPALDGYRDVVAVVAGPERLVDALENARAPSVRDTKERRTRVTGESWRARAMEVENLLRAF